MVGAVRGGWLSRAGIVLLGAATVAGAPGARAGVPGGLPAAAGPAAECPRADAVWAELQAAPSRAGGTAPAGPPPALEVIDLGRAFRVAINGHAREYRDDARDCARRARMAAVFAAVALGPPPVTPP